MQLDGPDVGAPAEGVQVVYEDIVDGAVLVVARHLARLYPVGRELGRILLVELESVHAIREADEGDGPVPEVGEYKIRDVDVVADQLALRERPRRKEYLVDMGERPGGRGPFRLCHGRRAPGGVRR